MDRSCPPAALASTLGGGSGAMAPWVGGWGTPCLLVWVYWEAGSDHHLGNRHPRGAISGQVQGVCCAFRELNYILSIFILRHKYCTYSQGHTERERERLREGGTRGNRE